MNRLPNYREDTNPFRLAGPPQWFLKRLYEFDASLAIVPSRQGFFYRLAQYRPLQLPEKVVNDVLKEQADTHMLASYGLVPVTTILATVNWDNPVIFEELRRRAPWRMGGAKKYEQTILDQERKEAMEGRVKQDEHLTYLSKDAWRFYNKKIGTRSHLYSPTTKGSTAPAKALSVSKPMSYYKPLITTNWSK